MFFLVLIFSVIQSKLFYSTNIEERQKFFTIFQKDFEKQYLNDNEYETRFRHFSNNLDLINTLNEKSEETEFGITQFADMT